MNLHHYSSIYIAANVCNSQIHIIPPSSCPPTLSLQQSLPAVKGAMVSVALKNWGSHFGWLPIFLQALFLAQSASSRTILNKTDYPPVQLHVLEKYIVMDNGIVNVTLSSPSGMITGISYNGIKNLLESAHSDHNRGYWDIVWKKPDHHGAIDELSCTDVRVVLYTKSQVELSFMRTWSSSRAGIPLHIDKRYVMLRGSSGFYSYAILERPEGGPAFNMSQMRLAFKLNHDLFHFMAISDERQRVMPTARDRLNGEELDYPEAVVLTNPSNPDLKGEVDDKYQYSSDDKDSRLHGWVCQKHRTGFWIITPSNEFKSSGPVKQDLTSHTGPVALATFFSTHYAGMPLMVNFRDGEQWKKVFGPVFTYLNNDPTAEQPRKLWNNAKIQLLEETFKWPYDFPMSEDYLSAKQRGDVSGRLLVLDRYMNDNPMDASYAYVGLAKPGEPGSWQKENKGYQFWNQSDYNGNFEINGVRPGNYSLYAWVQGFLGDYKYNTSIIIQPGCKIKLENIVFEPPRYGPTLWGIGNPDRTASEFFVPGPKPEFTNKLFRNVDGYRQYGLWDRYTDLYPHQDLVYTIGQSKYHRDWFFAHVNRKKGKKRYVPTTWQILFNLEKVDKSANYTLQLAIASATTAEVQVRVNKATSKRPHFTTGLIGRDNAIARHGIHGLYLMYSIPIRGSLLAPGNNTMFLTQSRGSSKWMGVMYDYIRFEVPPSMSQT